MDPAHFSNSQDSHSNGIIVCHLSSVHNAQDSRIFDKECVSLSKAGYRVKIICPHSYHETIGSIEIIPLPEIKFRLFRATFLQCLLIYRAFHIKANIYHFHDAELMPAAFILRLFRKRVIMDVHDDIIDFMDNKLYLPKFLRKPIGYLARGLQIVTTKYINAVVTASPAIARRFPFDKTVVVQNYPSLSEFPTKSAKPYHNRDNKIIFSGLWHQNAGFFSVINASRLLPPNISISIIGKINPSNLIKKIPKDGTIRYQSWQPREKVIDHMLNSRVGLAIYLPTKQNISSQPRKLYEYMAAGLPVVASDFPFWKDIIEKNKAGIHVDPNSPDQIADAIKYLINNPLEAEQMGINARSAFEKYFQWEHEETKLLALYNRVLR